MEMVPFVLLYLAAMVGISAALGIAGFTIGLWATLVASWFTHIFWSIGLLMTLTEPYPVGKIVLAAIGIFPPVGICHGFYLWFT